jgi:hypothetical protein
LTVRMSRESFTPHHDQKERLKEKSRHDVVAEKFRAFVASPERAADYRRWKNVLDARGGRGVALRRALEARLFSQGQQHSVSPPTSEAQAFLQAITTGEVVQAEDFPLAAKIFSGLREVDLGDGRVVDILAQLYEDPVHVPFSHKAELMYKEVAGLFDYVCACDVRLTREKLEKMRDEPVAPELLGEKVANAEECLPPRSDNTIRPTMDELERAKEGEAKAWFTLRRALGGYHATAIADAWDSRLLQFVRRERPQWHQQTDVVGGAEGDRRVLTGIARPNEITHLPMSRFGAPDPNTLRGRDLMLVSDRYGIIGIKNASSEPRAFAVDIVSANRVFDCAPVAGLGMEQVGWSGETQDVLASVRGMAGDNLVKARVLKKYTQRRLTYSNDSSFNDKYRLGGESSGYCARVENGGQADCDVANAYFLGLCEAVGIPAIMAAGHYVTSKDKTGASVMSSGTAHAWALVWQAGAWHRMDATPKGDPNMDDDETGEETDTPPNGGNNEGDFDEPEPGDGRLSDEEIEKILQEAEAEIKAKKTDREVERFTAAVAGCTPEEASKVLAELRYLENMQDSEGNFVLARLRRELAKIVQANMVRRLRIKQPVPLSQADAFDIVPMYIALEAGEDDPATGSKYEQRVKYEQAFSGMDVIFMADKSGSMREDDGSGVSRALTQMRLIMILCQAFAEASADVKRQGVTLLGGEPMRFGVVSFSSGLGRVELPLSDEWGEVQQYALWKRLQESVGGGTPDHKGLLEAKHMIASARVHDVRPRLTLVLGSTDGASDNAGLAQQALSSLLKERVVVECAGVGKGSESVVHTYTVDGECHGTHLEAFADVPAWAVSRVVTEAQKLLPKMR